MFNCPGGKLIEKLLAECQASPFEKPIEVEGFVYFVRPPGEDEITARTELTRKIIRYPYETVFNNLKMKQIKDNDGNRIFGAKVKYSITMMREG